MDLRPIFFVLGILLTIMSFSLVLPMLADLYFGYADWKVFFFCIIITGFFGGAMILSNTTPEFSLTLRQAFLLASVSWLVMAAFSALPFRFSEMEMGSADAFFEAMSGLTTTGATVIADLQDAPAGILLWRAILQWLGGMGIIIMYVSVLPYLKVGGMQLFHMESTQNEKAMPRTVRFAGAIGMIYLALTAICAIAYMFAGLGTFDAATHAMTTISTGGFSNGNESFLRYGTFAGIVAMVFMIIGALPFVLYLRAAQGNWTALLKDSQVRLFLHFLAGTTLILLAYLVIALDYPFLEALRRASFNAVSVMTGTGYTNGGYENWGTFPISFFLFLTMVGGCAGSTTSGIKIFRLEVLYTVVSVEVQKLLHPNGVFQPRYNGKPLPEDVPLSVMNFFFVFAFFFLMLAAALSFTGLDLITALSSSASAIANSGVGLGDVIGHPGTFQPLPDSAKWILSIGMLIGRLELITVLVLLSPFFWKN